jgi:signal peptidase II
MTSGRRPWARVAAVTGVVLILDQATKAIVRASIPRGGREQLLPFLDLVHTRNTGVAFGALAGGGVVVTIVIALALVALVAYFATHLHRPWAWLPTGLLLGGALGNIVDRLRDGAVTDFVKFPHFPAFNVADSAITIGVVVLLIVLERDGASRRT